MSRRLMGRDFLELILLVKGDKAYVWKSDLPLVRKLLSHFKETD